LDNWRTRRCLLWLSNCWNWSFFWICAYLWWSFGKKNFSRRKC